MNEHGNEWFEDWFEPVARWTRWLDGAVTGGPGVLPPHWRLAIDTVRRDMLHMQTGTKSYTWDCESALWNVYLDGNGTLIFDIRDLDGRIWVWTPEPTPADCAEAEAISWTAGRVQDELISDLWVLWPAFRDGPPMDVRTVEGRAVWTRSRSSNVVASVGDLARLQPKDNPDLRPTR
ncbi:hypothetical protein [Gordonia sp. KTR9]|uniref:hypothetical protein n=1 Tax=Gordonia sp. KTR9 TaxID=337191 RepID=UPI0005C820C2|nr:hypothetical protein [Gordonia sp. KTR9]